MGRGWDRSFNLPGLHFCAGHSCDLVGPASAARDGEAGYSIAGAECEFLTAMRITLVIASLWGGGTERVVTTLANGWIGQGHEVSILTFERAGAKTYGIHPAVKVWWLDLLGRSTHVMEGLSRNFRRIRSLRRALRES